MCFSARYSKMTATYDSLASFGRCSSSTEQNKSGGSEIEFTVAFVRSQTPPIPEGTKPLQLQVAGHVFGRANGHKKNKIGFLQSDDGTVLKPVLERKGLREVDVYQKMFDPNCTDSVLCNLRAFVPKFIGLWSTPVHPGQSYLRLEDVTRRFSKPSVMDVKIGSITYDREADEAKIAREKQKFAALGKVGFQVVGIKLYDPETSSYRNVDRTFLRTLDENTILTQGLALYFGAEQLVDAFLRRLRAIEEWFLNQTSYSFIASSLLFIYDSDAVYRRSRTANGVATPGDEHCLGSLSNHNDLCGSTTFDSNNNYDDVTDVRIIDLTHVFHTTGPDTNYLTGLRSLMAYLTKLDKSFNDRL